MLKETSHHEWTSEVETPGREDAANGEGCCEAGWVASEGRDHPHWKQAGILLHSEEDVLLYHNNANNKIA